MNSWAIVGFGVCLAFLLPACQSNNKNPLPLYLQAESALDAPGEAAARAQMLHSREKKGLFPNGSTVSVAGGRAFFFATNPELDGGEKGKMMEAKEVQIVTCEGLYYYVKTADGDGGYLRETDFLTPHADSSSVLPVSSLDDGPIMVQGADFCLPLTVEDGLLPLDAPALPDDAGLATKADGRVVRVISKKTEASDRFEAEAAKINNLHDDGGSSHAIPDLPEPSQSM